MKYTLSTLYSIYNGYRLIIYTDWHGGAGVTLENFFIASETNVVGQSYGIFSSSEQYLYETTNSSVVMDVSPNGKYLAVAKATTGSTVSLELYSIPLTEIESYPLAVKVVSTTGEPVRNVQIEVEPI